MLARLKAKGKPKPIRGSHSQKRPKSLPNITPPQKDILRVAQQNSPQKIQFKNKTKNGNPIFEFPPKQTSPRPKQLRGTAVGLFHLLSLVLCLVAHGAGGARQLLTHATVRWQTLWGPCGLPKTRKGEEIPPANHQHFENVQEILWLWLIMRPMSCGVSGGWFL